jgi:hypothetical protein
MLNLFSKNKHDENTPLMRALHYCEPNATWTDKNGAKTKKLRAKQDWKDLVMINRRFQGVAEEIFETQQIVLANRSKIRVRFIKGVGLGLVTGI